jgi:hypothetical protein
MRHGLTGRPWRVPLTPGDVPTVNELLVVFSIALIVVSVVMNRLSAWLERCNQEQHGEE